VGRSCEPWVAPITFESIAPNMNMRPPPPPPPHPHFHIFAPRLQTPMCNQFPTGLRPHENDPREQAAVHERYYATFSRKQLYVL